jgi:hypothetical protein
VVWLVVIFGVTVCFGVNIGGRMSGVRFWKGPSCA